MRKTIGAIAAGTALLCAGTVFAAPTAQEQCDGARVTAWKVYVNCVDATLARHAKGVFYADLWGPFARCRHSYFKKWAGFQTKAKYAGSTCVGARFTDNGDGTVSDNLTHLLWEKKANDSSVHDKDNTYTWSTATLETGTAFSTFVVALNNGLGFANTRSWRLPTVAELQTIVQDFSCSRTFPGPTCTCGASPCVDAGLGGFTQTSQYWSRNEVLSFSNEAWIVNFGDGSVSPLLKTLTENARGVSGGW